MCDWLIDWIWNWLIIGAATSLLSMWKNKMNAIAASRHEEFAGRLQSTGNKAELYSTPVDTGSNSRWKCAGKTETGATEAQVNNFFFHSFKLFLSATLPSRRLSSKRLVDDIHLAIFFFLLVYFFCSVLVSYSPTSSWNNFELIFTHAKTARLLRRYQETRLRLYIRTMYHCIDGILLASSKFGQRQLAI